MPIIDFILWTVAVLAVFPAAILVIECAAALLPARRIVTDQDAPRPRIAVVIPAHDEQSVIAATLGTITPQLDENDRVLVVADNCTDDTAATAAAAGAQVLQRRDDEHRGKGYALGHGVRHLAADPPDVVLFVDADCHVADGAVERIARLVWHTKRPVQARYLMQLPHKPSPRDAVSALAFLVKNRVRPRGLARLGLPTHITGAGMALPWAVASQTHLDTADIVEDMQMGVALTKAGAPPLYCDDAVVTSVLPDQRQAARTQRTRWEHGHLLTSLTHAPRLLLAGLGRCSWRLLGMGLDLCVPPLSLLVWVMIAAAGVLGAAMAIGASASPLMLVIAGLMTVASMVMIVWFVFARHQLPAVSILAAPIYMLWKIPIYLAFVWRRQKQWIRTERHAGS